MVLKVVKIQFPAKNKTAGGAVTAHPEVPIVPLVLRTNDSRNLERLIHAALAKDAFPGIVFTVHGTPKDLDGAIALALQDKYQFQWWAVSLVDAIPYGGKKKGADSGIDGFIYFRPDGKKTEKAIVSVKGGENVNVSMVRDLAHVIKRENAPMGIFITLSEATKPMLTEAVKKGFYETPYGKFARLQILTIAELMEGKQPHVPLDRYQ